MRAPVIHDLQEDFFVNDGEIIDQSSSITVFPTNNFLLCWEILFLLPFKRPILLFLDTLKGHLEGVVYTF